MLTYLNTSLLEIQVSVFAGNMEQRMGWCVLSGVTHHFNFNFYCFRGWEILSIAAVYGQEVSASS